MGWLMQELFPTFGETWRSVIGLLIIISLLVGIVIGFTGKRLGIRNHLVNSILWAIFGICLISYIFIPPSHFDGVSIALIFTSIIVFANSAFYFKDWRKSKSIKTEEK